MAKGKGTRAAKPPARRPAPWRTWVVVAAILVAGGGLGGWWWSARTAEGGTPHLVVDHEVIDLGYVKFDTPARAVFTVSNSGDGALVMRETPEVILVKGC